MKKDFNESITSLLESGYFSRVLVDDFPQFRQISDENRMSLDTLAHFDQRDVKAIFLTESSVYLSDVLSQAFSGDFRVFLVPPVKDDCLTQDEYLDYVYYQNYCCAFRMMTEFSFDHDVMSDQLEIIAAKARGRFPIELRRSELYKPCIRKQGMTLCVLTDLSVLEAPKVDVAWDCTHAPSGAADPVALSTGVPEQYHEFCDDENPNANGQVKLAVGEMQFLINMLVQGYDYDSVIFIGAAPGIHIPVVMEAFPALRYYAIDPAPVIPCENLTIIDFSENPDFICLERMMGPRYNMLLISDVFVNDADARIKIIEDYIRQISVYANVVAVMDKLFGDYMLPYTRVRHDAEIYFQPYLNGKSVEYRTVWWPGSPLVNVCSRKLDNKMNFFKKRIRPMTCKNDRCYECHYTWIVLNMTCAITGVDVSERLLMLRERKIPLPLAYTALLKLKTSRAAVKAITRGVHIAGVGHGFRYDQCANGYRARVKDSVIFVSDVAHQRGFFYDIKTRPPEFSKAAVCLVNDNIPMILPSYRRIDVSSCDVRLSNRRYRFRSSDPPSCPFCVTPGPSLAVYLKEFGDVVLSCCSRSYQYSGELSWSRMSIASDLDDEFYSV